MYHTQKSQTRERKGAKVLDFFVRYCGIDLCYAFAPLVVFCYFLSGGKQRRSIISFYRRLSAFRNEDIKNLQLYFKAFKNYLYFTASLIDRIALFQSKFDASNMRCLNPEIKDEPSAMLVGSHYGDWLISGAGFQRLEQRLFAVVINLQHTPKFRGLLEQSQLSIQAIDASKSGPEFVLQLKQILDEHGFVSFLVDRTEGQKAASVSFLGRKALFSLTPFLLAKKLHCPVYTFYCLKRGYRPQAQYEIMVEQLWDSREEISEQQLLARYVKDLEHHLTKWPQQWFNFFEFWL